MYFFVSAQQKSCNFAVPARPVEKYLLVLGVKAIFDIRVSDIFVNAARRKPEQKTFQTLRLCGFIYRPVAEAFLIKLNVPGRCAENSLDNLFARFDRPPNLPRDKPHFFKQFRTIIVQKKVEVDECLGCGGFWLDAGELRKIRSLYSSEQERQEAAEEYFSELFGDEFAAMEAENQAKLAKTKKIANMFRFICPSYYIPGRQGWGAF